jgi:hypothetical protein
MNEVFGYQPSAISENKELDGTSLKADDRKLSRC